MHQQLGSRNQGHTAGGGGANVQLIDGEMLQRPLPNRPNPNRSLKYPLDLRLSFQLEESPLSYTTTGSTHPTGGKASQLSHYNAFHSPYRGGSLTVVSLE